MYSCALSDCQEIVHLVDIFNYRMCSALIFSFWPKIPYILAFAPVAFAPVEFYNFFRQELPSFAPVDANN